MNRFLLVVFVPVFIFLSACKESSSLAENEEIIRKIQSELKSLDFGDGKARLERLRDLARRYREASGTEKVELAYQIDQLYADNLILKTLFKNNRPDSKEVSQVMREVGSYIRSLIEIRKKLETNYSKNETSEIIGPFRASRYATMDPFVSLEIPKRSCSREQYAAFKKQADAKEVERHLKNGLYLYLYAYDQAVYPKILLRAREMLVRKLDSSKKEEVLYLFDRMRLEPLYQDDPTSHEKAVERGRSRLIASGIREGDFEAFIEDFVQKAGPCMSDLPTLSRYLREDS